MIVLMSLAAEFTTKKAKPDLIVLSLAALSGEHGK
jgi:hypothetical protein